MSLFHFIKKKNQEEESEEVKQYLVENPGSLEVKESRSLNSKHFKNRDGSFTMHAHTGHVHYKNKKSKNSL